MTVEQQKMGLSSSSTEESALAVSLPKLYQITSNAPLWLAARRCAVCINNQALVQLNYTFKFLSSPCTLFLSRLECFPSSLLPSYTFTVSANQPLIHEAKVLILSVPTSAEWGCDAIRVLCSCSGTKDLILMRPLPFIGILIFVFTGSRKHTLTCARTVCTWAEHTNTHSLSLATSSLLITEPDQSLALSLWIQHYLALFIYIPPGLSWTF